MGWPGGRRDEQGRAGHVDLRLRHRAAQGRDARRAAAGWARGRWLRRAGGPLRRRGCPGSHVWLSARPGHAPVVTEPPSGAPESEGDRRRPQVPAAHWQPKHLVVTHQAPGSAGLPPPVPQDTTTGRSHRAPLAPVQFTPSHPPKSCHTICGTHIHTACLLVTEAAAVSQSVRDAHSQPVPAETWLHASRTRSPEQSPGCRHLPTAGTRQIRAGTALTGPPCSSGDAVTGPPRSSGDTDRIPPFLWGH